MKPIRSYMSSDLTVVKQNGQLIVDSREVAEMTGVRHADLLEKISGFIKHLTNGKFRSLDFFIESTYQDIKGETRPHYYLTRKGCDMVANKMTGEKGVLFTAAYVIKFEEMESKLSKPNSFPWADDMNKALRQEAKLTKGLSRIAAIRFRASMLRKLHEETGHDYSEQIRLLEVDAEAQEQKLLQAEARAEQKRIEAEAKAERRETKALANTPTGQASQALEWLRIEYAKQGDKLAHIHEEWLLVRSDLWKIWAGKNKLNLTMIFRELHKQGIVEKHSESGRERYGISKRIGGKALTFVWVKRHKLNWLTYAVTEQAQ